MKIRDLINQLKAIAAKTGDDTPVLIWDMGQGGRVPVGEAIWEDGINVLLEPATLPTTQLDRCECEHADHFTQGGAAHNYYALTTQREELKTDYGTFNICPWCIEHHFGGREL